MAWWLLPAIAGGLGLMGKASTGGFRGPRVPQYQYGAEEIDKLIKAYREQGMAGLGALGQREAEGATSRLASLGMTPSPALMQSVYMPILEKLAGARSQLEGGLAQTESQGLQHVADMLFGGQMQSNMAGWQDRQNLFGSLMDLGGMGLLEGLFGNNRRKLLPEYTTTTGGYGGLGVS